MIKFGLISKLDSEVLMKTIDLICNEFDENELNVTEIGVFDGQTARGIYEYITSKEYAYYDIELGRDVNADYYCNYTTIDNEKDKLIKLPFPECKFIRGNSNEVYNQLEDNSQHLIFVDALHTFPAVVADFFCYAPKVKVGGFLAFHDVGKHLDPLSQWQGVGDKNDTDFCLGGVRKALETIGLFKQISIWNGVDDLGNREYIGSPQYGWELIFDEADTADTGGGICVFKKLY